MNPAFAKISQVLAVAVCAFILGGWSFLLSGACTEFRDYRGTWAWVAAVLCIVGLAVNSFTLIRDGWRRHA
jgi:hypothetical protein